MRKGKYILSILFCFILVLGFFTSNNKIIEDELIINAQTVKDEREFKAVWVTPLVGDVNINGEQAFKTNMTEVLDIMEYYGLNALFFHVRSHNNAFYPSSLNPKASFISNIDFNRFDPIDWLIEESHKRGIEFHAWMNPYRYSTSYQTGAMPSVNPQANYETIEGKILNPASTSVKNHIFNTVDEFITRYPKVSSIHFDDYFYVSTSSAPTSASARREHINDLISGLHYRLNSFNSMNNTNIQLGISPTGIYANGNGVVTYDSNGMPITTGSNSRGQEHFGDYLYADTLKWIKEGWLDYIVPQVYWARDLSAAPFMNVLSWWDKVVKYLDVNLYTGIGLYKALEAGGAGWYTNPLEMNAQYNIIENDLDNVLGYSIYSFKHLKMAYYGDTGMIGKQVNNTYNDPNRRKIKVLPEIKTMTPIIPSSVPSSHSGGNITFNSVNNAKFYYIYASSGELTYSSDEIVGVTNNKPGIITYNIKNYNPNYNYGIRALSETNHLSPISTEPPVEVYNITYNLDGGSFDTTLYETREEMIVDFLTDFYNFLNPQVNLTTFMHGSGKTSGFDGLYDGDYFNQLFEPNNKGVNPSTGKFINQAAYNKWVPLIDLMDEYTNKGYPPQTFWGSVFTAQRRIKPFIQQINLWEEDGEPKASTIMEILNRIPAFDETESGVYYQYTKNYPDIVLPEAIKEGYRFLGWYTAPYGGDRVTVINKGSKGDKTFYARWGLIEEEKEEVLVTFNLDYDNRYLSPQTIEKGSFVLQPANPNREHYEFLGWYLNGSLFDFNTPINNNINLVARWSFSSFIVKFLDYDGTVLKEEVVLPGYNAVAPSNPNREGYTFTGWDKSYRNVYSDLTVNALYATAKYFVEFVDSDGTEINSLLVNYGTVIAEPTPPIKNGLSFIGWHLNNNIYDFNTPITSDITLTAWWDTLRFTVTFLNEDGSVFLTQSVEEGSRATRPSLNPFNDGYTFNTWTLNGSTYNFNNQVLSDITLMPSWDILVHTVSFLNYDHSIIVEVNVDHGNKVNKPSEPLRYGYTFKDWYLGDLPFNFNMGIYENVTLIANWNINTYTVKFLDYDDTLLSEQVIAHGSGAISPSSPNNKVGHIFTSWDRSFDNIVNYTEVRALYSPVNLFVDFIDENGEHIDTVVVKYGNKVSKPTNPYKEGFAFAGWLKEGVVFDFEQLIYEDITLKASYVFGGFTVTFYNEDGTIFLRQSVDSGSTVSKPSSNPYREGYNFNSWINGGSPFNFSTKIYRNLNLYPSWDILIHQVRFLDDDGSVIDVKNVNHGYLVTQLASPVKEGYDFVGWYLGDLEFNFTYGIYESIDLYARYNKEYYTVKFLDYDGTVLKEYSNVSYGESVSAPVSPNNKVGHYFSNWDKDYKNIKGNTIINAVYLKQNYFVIFYYYDDIIADSKLVPYLDKVNDIGDLYLKGYTFVGWTLNGVLFDLNTPITEDIELYAKWEINTYKVTFIDRGEVILEEEVTFKNKVNDPNLTLTRSGYSFKGWYLSGEVYNFNKEVEMDLILTAGWVSVGFTVTFLNDDGSIFKTVHVEADEKVSKPETNPVKEGYIFTDWLLNDLIYSFNLPVNSNITLKPSFEVMKHTVTFLDIDSTLIDNVKVIHGSKLTKPVNPSKTGHTFSGWYLGESLYDFNLNVYEPITLIARWNINTYRVRFFDGLTLLKTINVEYLGDATPPTVPIKEGYIFSGWDKSINNITENTDISAIYVISTYLVTFKDHEKVIKEVIVTHGKTANAPEPTLREGYDFIGWDKDFSNIKGDLVVNALYERITFTVKYYDFYDNILKEEFVYYNEYLNPPILPDIEGATFTSWLKDALVIYDIFMPVKSDLELYANYDVFTYTVRFLDYNNRLLKEEEVIHGNPATPPEEPERIGYIFSGWSLSYNVIKEDVDIYARYVKENTETYSVKFLDDNNNLIKEELVNANERVVKPVDPEKEGHLFVGWYIDNELYDFLNNITKDIILTASFTPKTYEVIYKDKDIIAVIEVLYNETIAIPNVPSKLGYIGSWEIDLTNIKIKTNYEIKAVYTLIDYEILYHNTRDMINNNPKTHTLLDLVVLEDLISTNEGNGFIGWYDSDGNEVLILAGPGNKEVFAKWQFNEYTVNFVDFDGNIISSQKIEHGSGAVEPNVINKEHYIFVGWDKPFSNVRSDLTVNALYVGKEYSLTFNTNGGSLIEKENVTYPNIPVIPSDPVKVGYIFSGWYLDSNFNNLYNFDEPLNKDMTIYAKFTINTYTVTIVDDRGNVIEQIYVNHGLDAIPKKVPIKEHYTHIGYDKDLTNITKNETIKALFTPNTYEISFDTLDNNIIYKESYIYPSHPEAITRPEKEGYDFVGWFTDLTFTTRFNFNKPLTENVTVYARWLEKIDDNKYISVYQSASIRYKAENSLQGLRFYARLNEEVKNNEHGFYLIYGPTNVEELRIAIHNKNSGGSFKVNGKEVIKVSVPGVDIDNTFSVVLTGIPEFGLIDSISAIGYVLIDGEEHFTLEPVTRSVAEVLFKTLNSEVSNDSLLSILNDITQKVTYSINSLGEIELNNNYFEYNHKYLKEEFINDFNKYLNKNYEDLNISDNDLINFYKDNYLKDKWLFMLDYFLSLSSNNNLNTQITNIKENKDNSSLEELRYAFNNFFNEENIKLDEEIIDFTNLSYYLKLKDYNDKIYINPNNYKLYEIGEEITLKEVNDSLTGYVFDHYLIDGLSYLENDKYIIEDKSVVFELVYKETNFTVTFIKDNATYLTMMINPFEKINELPVVYKAGYKFIGWYDSNDNLYNINLEVTKDITLYAKFEEINYINNVIIYINKDTYEIISHTDNITVSIYYDYNYVNVIVEALLGYEFAHDLNIIIYFNDKVGKVIDFEVTKHTLAYILDDPNYTGIY